MSKKGGAAAARPSSPIGATRGEKDKPNEFADGVAEESVRPSFDEVELFLRPFSGRADRVGGAVTGGGEGIADPDAGGRPLQVLSRCPLYCGHVTPHRAEAKGRP